MVVVRSRRRPPCRPIHRRCSRATTSAATSAPTTMRRHAGPPARGRARRRERPLCPKGAGHGERYDPRRRPRAAFRRRISPAPGGPVAPLADTDVVIVEAVRSPLGRRNGGLSTVHPADLLGAVQVAAIERSGIDPREVGQLVGGCVSQVGEQTFNIARTAWLSAGMPLEVAATTVDAQCGSSQQATNLAASLVKGGRGRRRAELRRREHEPGAARRGGPRRLRPPDAEVVLRPLRGDVAVRGRGAHRRQVGRHPRGLRPRSGSSRRPARSGPGPKAASSARCCRSTRRTSTRRASPPARPTTVARDEGLRETSLEALAKLKPVGA